MLNGVSQMWPYPYGGFWGMGLMMFFGFICLVFIGFLLYYFLRPRDSFLQVRDDPLEIAKARLARGEITPAEFEEIKKRLSG